MPPELPSEDSDLSSSAYHSQSFRERGARNNRGFFASSSGTLQGSAEFEDYKSDDEGSVTGGPPKLVWHKIEYRNLHTEQIVYTRDTDDINTEPPAPKDRPVMEVKRVVKTLSNLPYHSKEPPPTHSKGGTHIQIHSSAVMSALRYVTEYLPGSDYEGSSVTLEEPYAPIVFFLDELDRYRRTFDPKHFDQSVRGCKGLEDINDHLGVVTDFVRAHHKDALEKEYERHNRDRPVCTFDLLWTLFKPGTDVYYDRTSAALWDPYVVQSVMAGPYSIELQLWNLEFDGQYLQPQPRYATILPFEGEREIASLDIFPCDYLREDVHGYNHEAYRKKLEERGKLYYKLTTRQCMWYDGLTLTFPRRKYTDLVMVDTESYQTNHINTPSAAGMKSGMMASMPTPAVVDVGERSAGGIPGCACSRCSSLSSKTKKSPFAGYSRINPVNSKVLTAHQYFLCTRSVIGFVLKIRAWQRLDVGCFSEPKFKTNMIDELVLQKETRDLIKMLAYKYTRVDSETGEGMNDLWSADSVQGKGEGVIFLLHGKPGVGKTYTAECISEYTQRPLLSLTCTDIGTDPTEVDNKLRYWFKMAKHWGAILLIDEADIYMEQRVTQDLSRNNLVAGFLRAMEYYQGILFLTTNRVGTFDEAFISRIHVSIHYPDFSDKDRIEVWNNFFRKLENEREDSIRITIAAKEYATESKDLRRLKWNGREIRNAFQTAVALAEVENDRDPQGRVRLKDAHIKSIVRMSDQFKKYLHTLHQGDESKVALRYGRRDDYFEDGKNDDE